MTTEEYNNSLREFILLLLSLLLIITAATASAPSVLADDDDNNYCPVGMDLARIEGAIEALNEDEDIYEATYQLILVQESLERIIDREE